MLRSIRKAAVVALCGSAAIALSACGGGDGGGSTLRVGSAPFTSLWQSTNPFVGLDAARYQWVYPFLVQYDEKGEIAPDFAETWEASPDGKTYTFTTVADVQWSDGEPLTASDAAWTINTITKYRDGAAAELASESLPPGAKATAPDETTLVVEYEKPTALALGGLTGLPILPEHVWAEYATGKTGRSLQTFENPVPLVSGGPFVWTEFRPDEFALYERNESFYGPEPHIEAIGLQKYSNEDAMIQALIAGELDAVDYISPANVDKVEEAGLTVSSAPGLTADFIAVNSNPEKPGVLSELKVREALDMAIDRDRVVETVYGGRAEPAGSIIPAATPYWHNEDAQAPAFDTQRANEILDSLGYAKGSDGIRVAEGEAMEYEVIFPAYMEGAGSREFEIIRDGFNEIGVEVERRNFDSGPAELAALTAPDGKYLEMDMNVGNWLPGPDPDLLLSTYTCEGGPISPSGYCDADYDRAYERQTRLVDEDERRTAVMDLQQRALATHSQMAVVYPNWSFGHSDEWTGFSDALGLGWFGNRTSAALELRPTAD